MATRSCTITYLRFDEGTSDKFYAITKLPPECGGGSMVSYGKYGRGGQSHTHEGDFGKVTSLLNQKLKKGYKNISSAAIPAADIHGIRDAIIKQAGSLGKPVRLTWVALSGGALVFEDGKADKPLANPALAGAPKAHVEQKRDWAGDW